MRFIFAKHTLICRYCRGEIFRRELYIRTFHKNKDSGATFGFSYHYGCYLEDYVERVRKSALYWMGQQVPPKKRGRPVESTNPKEIRRLKALIRYHKKAGNLTRAAEVQEDLDRLRIL